MTTTTQRPSASEAAKAAGLPNLNYIQELTGVSRHTLNNWNKNKPALFDVVVAGCKVPFLHQREQRRQDRHAEAMEELAAEFPDCQRQCPSDRGRCICREQKAQKAAAMLSS